MITSARRRTTCQNYDYKSFLSPRSSHEKSLHRAAVEAPIGPDDWFGRAFAEGGAESLHPAQANGSISPTMVPASPSYSGGGHDACGAVSRLSASGCHISARNSESSAGVAQSPARSE